MIHTLINKWFIKISFQGWEYQYYKYDLMREYFLTIPLEEQDIIWQEVGPALEQRDAMIKRTVAKKALALSAKK